MTVQAYILIPTLAQKNAVVALNDGNAALMPQLINNAMANNLGFGTIVGQWVVPARLLNDSDYSRWYEMLENNDIHIFDSEVIFAPLEEV